MKLKRICAAMLAFTILLAGAGGCTKVTENSSTTSEAGQGSEGGAGRDAAMGRYVEEEIALPGEDGVMDNRFLRMVQREDGQVFLYGLIYDYEKREADILCYLWNGNGWDEQESKLDGAVLEGAAFGMPSIRQAADGTEYLTYIDWDTYSEDDMSVSTYIMKADPDGSRTLLAGWPQTTGIPDYVYIFDDESVLLSDYSDAVLYGKDGKQRKNLPQGHSYSDDRTLVTGRGREYVTIALDEASLLSYDIDTGTAGETIPIVKPDTWVEGEGALTLDQEGNLYMCNSGGIHFWKKGGSIWETLADGSLNSLSMPSQFIQDMVLGNDSDYLILAAGSGGSKILRFYYDSQVASLPSGTLSIFGLADNRTVRQAISLFQKQNPDIRVEFQVGDGGDGSTTVTDMIKALNTELVNQKGADILILDGLPIGSYIEKGVLADIGNVINPLLDDNTLLKEQTGFVKNEDGSVYSVPVRFQYPIMYGTPEGLAAMQSLEAIRDYKGSLPVLSGRTYPEVVKYLMNLYHAELFGDGKMIEKEQLVLLLEAAKEAYDRGLKPDPEEVNTYNLSYQFGLDTADGQALYAGETVISVELLSSVHNIMLPAEMMKQLDMKPVSANGVFFPSQMVGINASGNNRELAEEFIRLLLSEEIQTAELYDGFPVNRQAFENWRSYRNEDTMLGFSAVGGDGEEIHVTAVWPTPEQQNEIFAVREDMVTPVVADRVLTEIIIDEAKAYIDGKTDASAAADAIANRAALYFAE